MRLLSYFLKMTALKKIKLQMKTKYCLYFKQNSKFFISSFVYYLLILQENDGQTKRQRRSKERSSLNSLAENKVFR